MRNEEDYLLLQKELLEVYATEKKTLNRYLIFRLLAFGTTAFGIWLTFEEMWVVPFAIFAAGLSYFLILVRRNESLKFHHRVTEEKIKLVSLEIKALRGDSSSFGNGETFREVDHPYDYDLDILGDRSFFQSVNRTGTKKGEALLAKWLLDKEDLSETLELRQNALIELSEKVDFRQNFYVFGKIFGSDSEEDKVLSDWFNEFKPKYTRSFFYRIYRFLIPALTISALFFYMAGELKTSEFVTICLVPLTVAGIMLKNTNAIYTRAGERFKLLAKAGRLLMLIESENFESQLLKSRFENLKSSKWSSADIRNLDKIMNAFDSRLNPFVGIVLNIFLAWDVRCLFRLEKWILDHKEHGEQLYQDIAWWDSMCSLGTYTFNHPSYTFPIEDFEVVVGKDMGHPFLPNDSCVLNDFRIDSLGEFKIITGANMAGKSTFLRTVGLSLIMARLGLPVRASEFRFKPIKLYTSMRTTDSLQENESYFYTELKRLKGLVQRLDNGEELFIILDEILKGTNSKDKAEGSQRLIEKLLKYPVAGIVATHDLSLTTLGDKYEQVENICFEVEFGNEDLIFDYKLKPGVCKNMNATWLLEKMKLV